MGHHANIIPKLLQNYSNINYHHDFRRRVIQVFPSLVLYPPHKEQNMPLTSSSHLSIHSFIVRNLSQEIISNYPSIHSLKNSISPKHKKENNKQTNTNHSTKIKRPLNHSVIQSISPLMRSTYIIHIYIRENISPSLPFPPPKTQRNAMPEDLGFPGVGPKTCDQVFQLDRILLKTNWDTG